MSERTGNEAKIGMIFTFLAFVIFMLIVVFGSWFTVQPGEVAIKTRMGRIVDSYNEGVHFKIPMFEDITKFHIRIVRDDIVTDAFSQDLQPMNVRLAIGHRIDKDNVVEVYRSMGPNYLQTIIDPNVQEVFKAITAKYPADQIIAKRNEVVEALNAEIKGRMKSKQIIVTDIAVTDLHFSDKFIQAVEEKQVAEQDALKEKKNVEKAKMMAEQTIASAKAQAESLRLQKEQVTPLTLELKKLEVQREAILKWNGGVPTTVVGSGSAEKQIPFINVLNSK